MKTAPDAPGASAKSSFSEVLGPPARPRNFPVQVYIGVHGGHRESERPLARARLREVFVLDVKDGFAGSGERRLTGSILRTASTAR